ncbi:kinase-like domain-containing protein [Paraphysoderma sedebokerense]|nr:kinase-like domain-containing protein [Paraphysoderma sedebokerense]
MNNVIVTPQLVNTIVDYYKCRPKKKSNSNAKPQAVERFIYKIQKFRKQKFSKRVNSESNTTVGSAASQTTIKVEEKETINIQKKTFEKEAESNVPLPSGLKLEDFDSGKVLGQGTFGKVSVHTHLQTNKKVAIKEIDIEKLMEIEKTYNPELEKSGQARHYALKAIKAELKALKICKHPNIIKCLGNFHSNRKYYIVMEYANGKNLLEYINEHGTLTLEDAKKIFAQIVSALDHCRKASIVHRDIKPENIIIDDNMQIKLVDFGLATTSSTCNSVKGTLWYMAPEVIQRVNYGAAVDTWSLGVTLYVLLSRRFPFDGRTEQEVATNICLGDFAFPHYFTQETKNLIRGMLSIDPIERATMGEIVTHNWWDEKESLLCKALRAQDKAIVRVMQCYYRLKGCEEEGGA